MKSNNQSGKKSEVELWQRFIQAKLKDKSKLGRLLETAEFGDYDPKSKKLTLYLPDDDACKAARGQAERLKKDLLPVFGTCDRIEFLVGKAPVTKRTIVSGTASPKQKNGSIQEQATSTPLQALNHVEFKDDGRGKLSAKPILEAAVQAEEQCRDLYVLLRQRTESLAGGIENTLPISFNWRLRVGGTRGFGELLLPVFHPIFGIPYIPASSLKGAARAWARKNGEKVEEIECLFGFLHGKESGAARVEILDAFPLEPYLSGRCRKGNVGFARIGA